MEIIGHGIDCVEVARVDALLKKNGDFLEGWFTSRELDNLADRVDSASVVAGRVACKEAVVKALGCGFNDSVAWQDVEIIAAAAAVPSVILSGGAEEVAQALGVNRLVVSISNERTVAVASAIAVGTTSPHTRS
jgi:holo-[acyl-carrier protein] synthase